MNNIELTPDEIFELFTPKENDDYTIEDLANDLNVDVETLYDLSLEEISELSKLSEQIAVKKSERINKILDKRDNAANAIKTVQADTGITNDELSRMYFEELKTSILSK